MGVKWSMGREYNGTQVAPPQAQERCPRCPGGSTRSILPLGSFNPNEKEKDWKTWSSRRRNPRRKGSEKLSSDRTRPQELPESRGGAQNYGRGISPASLRVRSLRACQQ